MEKYRYTIADFDSPIFVADSDGMRRTRSKLPNHVSDLGGTFAEGMEGSHGKACKERVFAIYCQVRNLILQSIPDLQVL
jgi:hypothetical protein